MKLRSLFFPPPVKTRRYKRSLLFSMDDDSARPFDRLLDIATAAIHEARGVGLSDVSDRIVDDQR